MSTTIGWFPKPLRPTVHGLPYELAHDCGNLIELNGIELNDRHVAWLEGFAAASSDPVRSEVRALIAAIGRHGTVELVVEPWRDDVRDAAIELERLDAWKREAMAVIGVWEKVWVALGEPGALGALKSTNSLAAVQQLVADRDRLRDAVAAHHDCCCTDLWPELRDEP